MLGGEIDYNLAAMDAAAFGASLTDTANLKLRVGYDLNSVLVYGVGGLAYASLESGINTRSDTGYVVGLGADYKISSDWTAGAEYLFQYFDEFDTSNTDIQIQTLQARVSYHF